MGPVLKVKRVKDSNSQKSSAVPKLKKKWDKPKKKLISSQPGIMKIKKIKKHSFDPIKANRGVVLLQNIPHGFYEDAMKKYFGQFGLVTRLRLARSERTGRSKGFAYIEFKVPEVAQIAAETMNNYIMFKHVLKTVYIPPDKQTHNYFRKDVKFTTDADGQKTFSSAKLDQIEKEIEKINRIPTDEEHAKRLKRTQKSLNKQQKKYGIDLSGILVSGVNSSGEDIPAKESEDTETKKNVKKAEKQKIEKKSETKKDEKKTAIKKPEKKMQIEKTQVDNGKSLLGTLLNDTYNTDTSDDDFKIDHSFNASDEESSTNDESFIGLLGSKLNAAYKADADAYSSDMVSESDTDSDAESESEEQDSEMEESESEGDSEMSMEEKTFIKVGAAKVTNGSVDPKAKIGLKRKRNADSESMFKGQVTSSSQSEMDVQIKKKKQNHASKNETTSKSEISASEPETSKFTKKKKQKGPKAVENNTNFGTSSSEPEASNQKIKKKNPKQVTGEKSIANLTTTSTSASEPEALSSKNKKKKGKQVAVRQTTTNLSTSAIATSSSEPETMKLKTKKKALKNTVSEVNTSDLSHTTTNSSETEIVPQKMKKKTKLAANGKNTNLTTIDPKPNLKKKKQTPIAVEKISPNAMTSSSSEHDTPKMKMKKNKPAKNVQNNVNDTATSPSEPVVQNLKMKKKQKVAANGDVLLTSTLKPEAVNLEPKKKKQKSVTENGKSTKDMKNKSKTNLNISKADSAAWSTLSETDGDEVKKPKTKENLKLKTIVRKNVTTFSKKGVKTNVKDMKKVKDTPTDLLQLVPSKTLKLNQLKSKKKSK